MFRIIPRTITSCLVKQKCFYGAKCGDKSKDLIKVIDGDGVREIVFNDPKSRHALSDAMMDVIIAALVERANDNSLRCIVISSKGPVFSSGHNLKELAGGSKIQEKVFTKCRNMVQTISSSPVPVIAKVNGITAAGACRLVASCDISVCTEKSTFATPGINYGLFAHTPGVIMAKTMPRIKLSYMLITGWSLSATEANIAGLVSKLVPVDKLDEEVCKICDSIKNKSRIVIKMGKEFLQRQQGLSMRDAYSEAREMMVKNLNLQDGQEGLRSFVEKRKPIWKNC